MAVSRTSRKLIESSDFAGLEDEWLSRLTDDAHDLDYFVGVARALSGNGQEARAADLLEILDDQLVGESSWETRLALLKSAGPLFLESRKLHEALLETLRRIYPESPSRDGLMELVGLHRAIDDHRKTIDKVARLCTLLDFEVGSVVWMKDKGAGRVVEVNLELQKLKIDFEDHPSLAVGLRAAGKLLRPLPESHFLHRKLESPDEMRRLAKKDPSACLELLLESGDEPLSATAIRKSLSGLVGEKEWSSWWSAARSHPHLIASGKGARQTYRLAASQDEAQEEILRTFRARDLATQLNIYRREAKRDAALRRAMSAELEEEGRSLAASDPAASMSIWLALEKTGNRPDDDGWSPASLIAESRDPAGWIAACEDRVLRTYAARVVKEVRSDPSAVFSRWIRHETDSRLLSQLCGEIAAEDRKTLDGFLDDVLAKPRQHPLVFVWLLETSGDHDYLEGRNPLRLLQQTLEALRQNEFSSLKTRLGNVIEKGDVLARLIAALEPSQAEQAEELLKRAPLEEYVRERLVTGLHLEFPGLRSSESDALYATAPAIRTRRRELKRLLEEEIPANRNAIEEARALGDLRENFEYKSARQRHEYLTARATALDGDLKRVQPIDFDKVDTASVRVGAAVTLSSEGGESRMLTLLGPWESAPERDVISYQSETAQKLLGKKAGETVEIEGETWKVGSIEVARLEKESPG